MSKKSNTIWFMLGATVFNILVTIISFVVLLVVYARFLAPLLPEETAAWGFPIIFIGSIVLSFVVYRLVIKLLFKKIDMEKYFDPIFGPRKPPARKD
ncbi:leader peptide processing enzyme [Breznakiella homolactica]|uniref:Leader peptide processing enzyme n=1 Tax=Breznakiella homolactica TaxID=2798577 RepID=A0A7T8BBM8_9SPIR|nr:leader peptide processing enzyme [Breznakiella homolactica]QQO10235.1 leader peptide processing enzyme [Breznakiella homolactica]